MRGRPLSEILQRVAAARGFIFDMDGTIALGDAASGGHKAIAGAIELLSHLRAAGIPYRVFTNGSAKPPEVYAASLRTAGFDLHDHEMMTPCTSAADYFASKGIRRIRLLGNDVVMDTFRVRGIEVVGPNDAADGVQAVFTGWFREFGLHHMEIAVRDIWAGASLTTASNVPFFATAQGRAIGSSYAINAMIRALTGKRAKVLGKPSRVAFDTALRSMGLPRSAAPDIVVVGDDPGLEMRMANGAGAISIGVATGLQTPESMAAALPAERPALALKSVADLVLA